jgi:carboxymethylenebutenolidase
MASRTVTVTVGGNPMSIYLGVPEGNGPFPGVVVMFHRAGIDAFTRDRVDRLAAAGYVAAAPDLYHRLPETMDEPTKMVSLKDVEILADVQATADYFGEIRIVRGDRLAILGHCMGGRMAFLGGAANPSFRASVIYYCGNMFKPWGEGVPTPFDRLAGLKGPVIGFFGNDDKNPSPDDVTKIDQALTKFGIPHEVHRYDGAGHAFQNFVRDDVHRPAQAADAWAKTLAFLHRELGDR